MASTKCAVVNGMIAGEVVGIIASGHLDLDALAGELDGLDGDVGARGLEPRPLDLHGPGVAGSSMS